MFMKMLKENVAALHQLILENKTLEALEKFYSPSIVMQENDEPGRVGKQANLINEKENLKKIKAIKAYLINTAVNEHTGIVMSEWKYELIYLDGGMFLLEETSVQQWKDNQVVFERFYYEGIKPIKVECPHQKEALKNNIESAFLKSNHPNPITEIIKKEQIMLNGPDPQAIYPSPRYANVVFLKNIITRKNIEIGDYTYYHDFEDPYNFEKNVLYHSELAPDKLIIGKFCAIASGIKFIMNTANHQINAVSTFPFTMFDHSWEKIKEQTEVNKKKNYKGNVVIGNDVWIGLEVTIMPGIKIGHGAIIAGKSVVTKDVPDYGVVGGNPAKLIRKRFNDNDIERLLKIAWWDWEVELITEHLSLIASLDIDALWNIRFPMKNIKMAAHELDPISG